MDSKVLRSLDIFNKKLERNHSNYLGLHYEDLFFQIESIIEKFQTKLTRQRRKTLAIHINKKLISYVGFAWFCGLPFWLTKIQLTNFWQSITNITN
ncbi:hypothetical protein BpHYR1_023691 [Brachionus plicatilis]|uniref:Uncharacterized protein n=1 Tax=Brachionus plicatilis TaxID=10195 RepID=A0A3M7PLR8_BRAPC|nr:hypothetical protein BpHYR1_023691 [Brachionus plicatilis]